MEILGIEHIGIAVSSDSEAGQFWNVIFGISDPVKETITEQGVETSIYKTDRGKIELLNSLNDDSPIAKYLKKNGPGIHHICLEVADIKAAMQELEKRGISLIYDEPKIGAEGFLINFIHPQKSGGVLLELAQKKG